MKRIGSIGIAVCLLLICGNINMIVYASNFEGQEEYYSSYCASPRANEEEAQVCRDFKAYMKNKSSSLDSEIAGLNDRIASIQGEISSIEAQLNTYHDVIKQIETEIADNIQRIQEIEEHVLVLEADIKETEDDIEKRDALIKERMVSSQAGIGTNTYIEFLMGAKDLIEFIQIADGIQRITESDQEEIEKLNEDKKKLVLQKGEQQRLKEDVESKKKENEKRKQQEEEAKKGQELLLAEYQKHEADLLQERRSQQSRADAVQSAIISINTSVAGSVPSVEPSDGWIRPVSGGYNAHTFFYPGGGFHAGADFTANSPTPIQAPISGIVLYSSNPYGTYSGRYPSNDGFPNGAGNSIHMVGQVNGTTYGISFFHMAHENWATAAGQSVMQGQIIGYSGNSGNTTGPHLHVEIINLGSMSMEAAIARFQSTLDFAWGTGWNTTSTACIYNGYSTPCRERPEEIFG